MQSFAKLAISLARSKNMFLVLDADALFLIGKDVSIIKGYPRAVLTPNVVEFKRLSEVVGVSPEVPADERAERISRILGGVTVLEKGKCDTIAVDTTGGCTAGAENKEVVQVDVEGGLKRCGGQGDVLSGSVGTFMAWGKCYEDGAFG